MAAVTQDSLTEVLTKALDPAHLTVSVAGEGCGLAVDVVAVSDKFTGMSRVDAQRAVTDALGDAMDSIHAVTIKAMTVAKWETKQAAASVGAAPAAST